MDEPHAIDDQQANDLVTDEPQASEPQVDEPGTNEPGMDEPNARRRFFNRAERFVLQAGAGGRCEECGAALGDSFHADHRLPFAAGGPTALENAQALCPDCNRRKGARLTWEGAPLTPETAPLTPEGTSLTPEAARLISEAARLTPEGAPPRPEDRSVPPVAPAMSSPTPISPLPINPTPISSVTAAPTRPPLPDWTLPLRPWQQQGVGVWERLRNQGTTNVTLSGTNTNMTGTNMTITATPGSGKTNLALFLAAKELREGRADLLVVVVPSRTLKDQWAQSAHRAGLTLTAGWGNNSVALLPDVHGCIVTYAQVASLPDALRLLCTRRRVFCVLDEIHHAAESRAWGDALYQALEYAVGRLCLSGTAWRHDGNMIPFVTYDAAGRSQSDLSYPYPQALRDGVVRQAFFFALYARTVWLDEAGERTATFGDVLGERDQGRRLRASLHAEGGWLEAAILRADAALSAARRGPGRSTTGRSTTGRSTHSPHAVGHSHATGHPHAVDHPYVTGHPQSVGHPQAKGLVVTMNAAHARAVARRMLALTGEMPAIALSDDPASLGVLTRFRSGGGRWLVVCRMAGEGYDCPDIRVVLWATNVTGEGAFRQLVARALRVVPGLLHQDAQVFLPADRRLLALARGLVHPSGGLSRVEEGGPWESDAGDGDLEEDEGANGLEANGREGVEPRGEGAGLFVPLTSRVLGQRVVTNGAVVPASAFRRAQRLNAASWGLPDYAMAAALARMEAQEGAARAGALPPTDRSFTDPSFTGGNAVPSRNAVPSAEPARQSHTGSHAPLESQGLLESEADGIEQEEAGLEEAGLEENATYDQRRQELRRLCTRLTARIARELDVNPSLVHRAFYRSLGVRQADSTLAQLEQRKAQLEDKLRQLRAGSD